MDKENLKVSIISIPQHHIGAFFLKAHPEQSKNDHFSITNMENRITKLACLLLYNNIDKVV
ncbi:hypothetical protein F909_02908 [Acinetobacter sp. ANC 3929]|uniref:hypothetical protein n=1 Tax=unclassified Acinetobacter TaxID=196816 RepID=UPI0002D0AE74|nr:MULTISPECIES: hypothetical protein [unclassified Acinetobacter]ENW79805.1 hypothetical protein F909_02908 [Acinetobacter sp. ANC 3929]MCH7352044.1 hypothetical protein [Acinetobacter sp. NIPH 2023]MCH7354599.1 hypothetical protein [Acinetobacter sp. NIPH 1958]MCH7359722.1 hypothetical protein [Acinetobacter sp. NIPH 2024]